MDAASWCAACAVNLQPSQEGGWDGMGQDGMGWGWSVCVSGAVSRLQHGRRTSVQ